MIGVQGTRETGYSTKGPFRCDNCSHYHRINMLRGTCDQPKVNSDPEVPKLKDKAQVSAHGCCTYFNRKGN